MKRTLTVMLLLFSFLFLFCRTVNCTETQSSKKTQQTLSKPILPTAIPSPLPSVSFTLSPNISMPPIMLDSMNAQKNNTDIQFRGFQNAIPILPNLPTLPTLRITKVVPSVPILSQKIQLIKNISGTVVNIGLEKDEILWIEIKDRFSDNTVKINVDSKKTRVIKKDVKLTLQDIKIGDMVHIIFNQAGKEVPVNVISIISEEDFKINTQSK